MSKGRGDAVRTALYDPVLRGRIDYDGLRTLSNNKSRNLTMEYERFYINFLTEVACNRFKWDGLPDEIDERFLETQLFHTGVVLYWHESKKYDKDVVTRCGQMGPLNIYDRPTFYQAIAGTGEFQLNENLVEWDYGMEKGDNDCIPIWANYMRTAEIANVVSWANQLAEIDVTIRIATKNARQSRLVSVGDSQRLSAQNIMKQIDEGVPVIYGTEEMSQVTDNIQTIDLESHPQKLVNLLVARSKIWNNIMTFMGVKNSNQEKKERLVEAEVSANDEQTDLVRQMHLNARQQAADLISKRFDLKVTVDYRTTENLEIDPGQNISGPSTPGATIIERGV